MITKSLRKLYINGHGEANLLLDYTNYNKCKNAY